MIDMIMVYNNMIRYRKNECDFLGVQILMRTFNIRDKSQNNGGGIPTKMLIAQQPKAIESRNWYQLIAMPIFYNHVIWYINTLTSLFLKFLSKLKI